MEIKIKLDESFFVGFFTGIILSLILVAASLGIAMGAMHLRSAAGGGAAYPYPQIPSPAVPAAGNQAAPAPQGPSQGADSATIKLLEFSDFHCPFCRNAAPTIQQLVDKFPGKIKREFHHFPLSETPGTGSFLTHEWAACASDQGKFWAFHDAVYAMPTPPQPADLPSLAAKIGLNVVDMEACVKAGKYQG